MKTAHRKPHTPYRISHTALLFLLSAFCILLSVSVSAQRIEVHGIKDLSNNSTANKAWGVGAALDFDQLVKKTTFRVNFNWTTYRSKNKETNPRYDRLSGGISAFYSVNISKKFSLQCGAEVNYTNLKYSYRYAIEEVGPQTEKVLTLQQTGHFIGVGPHVGFNYELSPRFSIRFNFIPTYLISVGSKSSAPDVEPEYSKGMWLFPLQLGISYKLFNSEQ
jgi:hypothetical protein